MFCVSRKDLESTEFDELCYEWKEDTKNPIVHFDLDSILFERGIKLKKIGYCIWL